MLLVTFSYFRYGGVKTTCHGTDWYRYRGFVAIAEGMLLKQHRTVRRTPLHADRLLPLASFCLEKRVSIRYRFGSVESRIIKCQQSVRGSRIPSIQTCMSGLYYFTN